MGRNRGEASFRRDFRTSFMLAAPEIADVFLEAFPFLEKDDQTDPDGFPGQGGLGISGQLSQGADPRKPFLVELHGHGLPDGFGRADGKGG